MSKMLHSNKYHAMDTFEVSCYMILKTSHRLRKCNFIAILGQTEV